MTELTLVKYKSIFEQALSQWFTQQTTPNLIFEPMRYSLNNGGKRLRPVMLLAALELGGHDELEDGFKTAIALEYIHTYSLIHDDLPAMDNDVLRRGQPTNHVKFGEAPAILAGDGLLTDAFGLIADDTRTTAAQKVALIASLSKSAGASGMVYGQMLDMQAEDYPVTIEQLKTIHEHKTGRLFLFALEAAGIIGDFSPKLKQLLKQFGTHFGVAYQIHNDLIDTQNDALNPDAGQASDAKNHKMTYPVLLGYNEAIDALNLEKQLAKETLQTITEYTKRDTQPFNELIDVIHFEK